MAETAVAETPASTTTAERAEAVTELASTAVPKMEDWVSSFLTEPEAPASTEETPPEADKPKEEAPKVVDKVDDKPVVTETPKDVEDKRLKDTRDWATRVNQENLALSTQLKEALKDIKTLKAQLDGTYEPPPTPTREEIEAKAVEQTKFAASGLAAVEMYGQDEVNKLVLAPDAPFQVLAKDPAVMARVNTAPLPVVEAVKIVKEHQKAVKYGSTPEEIREKLRPELEAELTEKITKQVTEALAKERTTRKLPTPIVGLGGVRGVGQVESKASNDQPLKMTDLFPNFTPTHG